MVTRFLSFNREAGWKKKLVNSLPDEGAPACLDLACGTGDISFLLAEKYPHGDVTGLDLTREMLNVAKARNRYPNVTLIQQDMGSMTIKDASKDLITGGYALRNASDLEHLLKEVHRILKCGGHAAFLDFSKPANKLLQKISYLLLKVWGSLWGIVLHGNHEVYGYIAESMKIYPDRKTLKAMIQDTGFSDVQSHLYCLGLMELVFFEKPPAPHKE